MADDTITVTNPRARFGEKAETRTIDAPPGIGHVENFAKLVQLDQQDRYGPSSAEVVRNNAVLLDAGVDPPDVVGTIEPGEHAAISRLQQSFTTKDYAASFDVAPPPVPIRASAFAAPPQVIDVGGGSATIRLQATPAGVSAWPGYVAILIATEAFLYQGPNPPTTYPWNRTPFNGHLTPADAEGVIWLQPLPDSGVYETTITQYTSAYVGLRSLVDNARYYASAYLTSMTIPALPGGVGEFGLVTSYPSAPIVWLQTP